MNRLHHCPTCTCVTQLRMDKFGVLLSPYHTLCPVCEGAITKDLLKRLGGICATCNRTAQVRKKIVKPLRAIL